MKNRIKKETKHELEKGRLTGGGGRRRGGEGERKEEYRYEGKSRGNPPTGDEKARGDRGPRLISIRNYGEGGERRGEAIDGNIRHGWEWERMSVW